MRALINLPPLPPQAARLLRSSILKIEQSDIELEDLAPVPNYEREGAEGEDAEMHDAAAAQAGGAEEDATMTDAGGAAAAAADGEEEEAVIEEVAPVVKEPTKITAQKFNYIRVRGVAEWKVEGGPRPSHRGGRQGACGGIPYAPPASPPRASCAAYIIPSHSTHYPHYIPKPHYLSSTHAHHHGAVPLPAEHAG